MTPQSSHQNELDLGSFWSRAQQVEWEYLLVRIFTGPGPLLEKAAVAVRRIAIRGIAVYNVYTIVYTAYQSQ